MNAQRKVSLFIATTLDGYIATKDDSLDWLFEVEGEGDNGIEAFYDTTDAVIMGKRTYDWLMAQELEEFPYKGRDCYVFSRSKHEDTPYVKFISGDVSTFVHGLKKREGKKIWLMGGGELIRAFLSDDLVDEIIVTIAPVILGSGIPLFPEGDYRLDLDLKGTNSFGQFVELSYDVKKRNKQSRPV